MVYFSFFKNLFDIEKFKIFYNNFTVSNEKLYQIFETFLIFFSLLVLNFLFNYNNISVGEIPTRFFDFFLYFFGLNFFYITIKTCTLSTYTKIKKYDEEFLDNFILGFTLILNLLYVIILINFIIIFSKVDISNFLTALSVLAIGLLWSFKDYISNFVDGFIILFSKEFNVSDYIQVGEIFGRIKKVTFFKTHLKLDDGTTIIFSNSKFLNSDLVNYSTTKTKVFFYRFSISKENFKKIKIIEKSLLRSLKKKYELYLLTNNLPDLSIQKIESEKIVLLLKIPLSKAPKKFFIELKKHISDFVLKIIVK